MFILLANKNYLTLSNYSTANFLPICLIFCKFTPEQLKIVQRRMNDSKESPMRKNDTPRIYVEFTSSQKFLLTDSRPNAFLLNFRSPVTIKLKSVSIKTSQESVFQNYCFNGRMLNIFYIIF